MTGCELCGTLKANPKRWTYRPQPKHDFENKAQEVEFVTCEECGNFLIERIHRTISGLMPEFKDLAEAEAEAQKKLQDEYLKCRDATAKRRRELFKRAENP